MNNDKTGEITKVRLTVEVNGEELVRDYIINCDFLTDSQTWGERVVEMANSALSIDKF